jgi:hypothetical protein
VKRFSVLVLALLVVGCATTSNYQTYISPSEIKESSQIIISRENAFLYSGISANIRLNGDKVGTLSKGSSQSFYAPAGRNFISITAFGSPGESTISFNTKKGENYSLVIGPRGNSLGGFLGGALYLAIEADGKNGGLFSISLVSSSEEN